MESPMYEEQFYQSPSGALEIELAGTQLDRAPL
jgi:hypothetical protein